MLSISKKVFLRTTSFKVSENVYEPAKDSFLCTENLAVKKAETVLGMGTQSRILALTVAKKAMKAVAVDMTPKAVKCTKENARLNEAETKSFSCKGTFDALYIV